ncbi:tellurite resistance protein TehB [Actinomyces bovis]|uniref:Tellurite resistance protein TehB n=1 Tax=Actinomyces bovis TaxID=1658 RepID=A0ABY1VQP8_9ACTO|nr:class I SAM-dependent methyltransferase [Actinomyces bovis]SPT54446.1 tellurite resistance protein TehB [Actinomyces bovis]VEG55946.1 tellurite resistance protein TehB [Actinomyces israelii]
MSHSHPTDWEARYTSVDRLWSGQPNEWLTAAASSWQPGSSLDVGCGEGDDVLWLAAQGWQATGIDLAPTAIARMLEGAREQGLAAMVTGRAWDVLAQGLPEGSWDLVTSFFMHGSHEPGGLDLVELLAQMAARVAPGGRLMTVVHAVNPPWRPAHLRTYRATELLTELAAALGGAGEGLGAGGSVGEGFSDDKGAGSLPGWQVEQCTEHWAQATGPDGTTARKADAVLVLRRESV